MPLSRRSAETGKLTLFPFPQRAYKLKRPSRARACSCSSRGGTGSACKAALQIRTTLRTSTTGGYPAFPRTGATAGRSRRNPPHRQRRNPRVSGPGQRHGEPLRRVGPTLGVRHLPAPADRTPLTLYRAWVCCCRSFILSGCQLPASLCRAAAGVQQDREPAAWQVCHLW